MVNKNYLMACVAVAAFGAPCLSYAQQAADPVQASTLDEVVVTATRRSESVQKVPATVISNSAEQLQAANVVETRDLNRVVPGFVLTSQNAWASPSIRGVSSSVVSPGGEGPVAFYVDGIYEPSQQGQFADMPDVERVEVAKGPQGTLFGRNATGGAVQIFTRGPSFTPHASFGASSSAWLGGAADGGLTNVSFNGFVSGPVLADKLAGSLAVSSRNSSGYSINDVDGGVFGDVRTELYRGKLLFEPTENLSVLAGAFYTARYDENVFNGGNIGRGIIDGLPGVITATEDYHVSFNTPTPHLEYTEGGGFIKATLDLGIGSLTNTATYRSLKSLVYSNVSGSAALATSPLGQRCFNTLKCSNFQVKQNSESYSDELLFTSRQFGPLNFLVGAFAYHENAYGDYRLNNYPGSAFPGGFKLFDYTVDTNSYAIFAAANFDLTSRLHLAVGGRYTSDEKIQPNNTFASSTTWTNFSPRVSVRYDWTDRFNIYITYSEGFRSGVYSSTFTSPPLNPENLVSYEIGAKYQSGRFRANLSAFSYEYTDLQLSTFTGAGAVLSNANASMEGLDFDGEIQLNEHFRLRGGGSYLPTAEYSTYNNAAAFLVNATNPVVTYDGTATCGGYCGVRQLTVNATGSRMLKAPELTGFVSLNYESAVSTGLVTANLSAYYSSEVHYDVVSFVKADSYVTVDGDISFAPQSIPELKITLFAKNITNAQYLNGFSITAQAAQRYFSAPPEAGIRVGYSF